MGRNALLSWKPNEFLDSLSHALNCECPLINRLERYVISVLNQQDETVVRRYFLLYTIPILEACGFTSTRDWKNLCFWGLLQTRLGVHLRHLDNILDGDQSVPNTAAAFLTAHQLLSDAKEHLASRHMQWGRQQDDIYEQCLAFEAENHFGFNHSFDSLWRRVSPLCVVTETYLSQTTPRHLALVYRDYLAWALLQADCDDALKDLRSGANTPVTRIIRAATVGVHGDWHAGMEANEEIKRFLDRRSQLLQRVLNECPLWRRLFQRLEETFAHHELIQ